MRIGLSYDLKTAVIKNHNVDDALEEYDSPETVEIIAGALEKMGHHTIRLGGGALFIDNIRREKVDFVFNISEGRGNYRSREAQVPAILEMLDIPYTGSDPLTLAVCLDKPITKQLVSLAGIPTPKWLIISNVKELGEVDWKAFGFPAIIKPAYEGSSKGIRLTSLVEDVKQAGAEVMRILKDYNQSVMAEEFIDGEEVTVGVIGNHPPKLVGMMRVVPKQKPQHFVYSLEVKRDYLNLVDYETPVKLPNPILKKLEEHALKIFKTLGCRDFSRVDFRVGLNGTPYFLEINPLPGLGTYSDLVIMAGKQGWTHERLIGSVLDAAIERYPQCSSA
jgi:D-alanine-D-alanine ligase